MIADRARYTWEQQVSREARQGEGHATMTSCYDCTLCMSLPCSSPPDMILRRPCQIEPSLRRMQKKEHRSYVIGLFVAVITLWYVARRASAHSLVLILPSSPPSAQTEVTTRRPLLASLSCQLSHSYFAHHRVR